MQQFLNTFKLNFSPVQAAWKTVKSNIRKLSLFEKIKAFQIKRTKNFLGQILILEINDAEIFWFSNFKGRTWFVFFPGTYFLPSSTNVNISFFQKIIVKNRPHRCFLKMFS